METQNEKRIGLYFHISIYIKGLFSLIETLGGILAFFVPASAVTNVVIRLANGELAEGQYHSPLARPVQREVAD